MGDIGPSMGDGIFILHGLSTPWFHVIGLGGIKVRLRNLRVIKGILISFANGCFPARGYDKSNLKRWFKLVTKVSVVGVAINRFVCPCVLYMHMSLNYKKTSNKINI